MAEPPTLAFQAITQDFPQPGGDDALRVLDGLSFDVPPGRIVSVIGPSGCGKSTLLGVGALGRSRDSRMLILLWFEHPDAA